MHDLESFEWGLLEEGMYFFTGVTMPGNGSLIIKNV
jgi:hypothetical protein